MVFGNPFINVHYNPVFSGETREAPSSNALGIASIDGS